MCPWGNGAKKKTFHGEKVRFGKGCGPRRRCSSWRRCVLRPNPSLGRGAMAVQSSGSLAGTLSGLHFGSPNKMCHSDVASATSRRE
jgi:hypothetical protein